MNIEILSDCAGIAGLLLSIALAIREFLRARMCFDFLVLDYVVVRNVTQFFVSIANKSKTPLVITEILFHDVSCELEPKKIRGEPGQWNAVTTPRFPLSVPGQDAKFMYLEFVGCSDNQLTADIFVTFQIQTISRQVSRTVLLQGTSHYLHSR